MEDLPRQPGHLLCVHYHGLDRNQMILVQDSALASTINELWFISSLFAIALTPSGQCLSFKQSIVSLELYQIETFHKCVPRLISPMFWQKKIWLLWQASQALHIYSVGPCHMFNISQSVLFMRHSQQHLTCFPSRSLTDHRRLFSPTLMTWVLLRISLIWAIRVLRHREHQNGCRRWQLQSETISEVFYGYTFFCQVYVLNNNSS